jgi:hypothetical protein
MELFHNVHRLCFSPPAAAAPDAFFCITCKIPTKTSCLSLDPFSHTWIQLFCFMLPTQKLSVYLSVCRLTFSSFSTLVLAFTIRRMLAKVLKNLLDAPILLHHTQAHSPPSSLLLLVTCTLHTLSKQANSIAPLKAHDNNSSKHTNQKQTNKKSSKPRQRKQSSTKSESTEDKQE